MKHIMKKIAFVLSFAIVPYAIAGTTQNDNLSSVIEEVLSTNFALKAARLRWESAQARPQIVGALPDPMLTYGYFFRNVETRTGPMKQKFIASQKFPFPGKLSLAADRAEAHGPMVTIKNRKYSSGTELFPVGITAPIQGHFILDKTLAIRVNLPKSLH